MGDAVAHRGDSARELRDTTRFPSRALDPIGEFGERLVGGEQVVVRGDDRDAGFAGLPDGEQVGAGAGGEAVGEVAASQSGPDGALTGGIGDARAAAQGDDRGDEADGEGAKGTGHRRSFQAVSL